MSKLWVDDQNLNAIFSRRSRIVGEMVLVEEHFNWKCRIWSKWYRIWRF